MYGHNLIVNRINFGTFYLRFTSLVNLPNVPLIRRFTIRRAVLPKIHSLRTGGRPIWGCPINVLLSVGRVIVTMNAVIFSTEEFEKRNFGLNECQNIPNEAKNSATRNVNENHISVQKSDSLHFSCIAHPL